MLKKRNLPLITGIFIATDILFIFIADLVSFIVRFNGQFPEKNFNAYLQLAYFIILMRLAAFYVFHIYESPQYKTSFEMTINTLKATTVSSLIIICTLYFFSIEPYPRIIALLSWAFTIIFISGWRFIAKQFTNLYLGKDLFMVHLLIIGADKEAQQVAMQALSDIRIDYKLIGFIDTGKTIPFGIEKSEILGTLDNLPKILSTHNVDEVIVADTSLDNQTIIQLFHIVSHRGIALRSLPATYETVVSNLMLTQVGGPFIGPTFFTAPAAWYWGLKRILDILFSTIILIITGPVILLAMLLIKLTSKGPSLYFQKRTGLNGKPFVIYKLRTMYTNAEEKDQPRWAEESDPRITPIGKLLRHYRIDELLQLLNVLKNDMSLIGPRPERPYFTTRLVKKIPFYSQRLQVKPGISGWAQVNFKYTNSEEDTAKKLVYDLFYIQNMSFTLDLLIGLKTLKVVIAGQGAH